MATVIAADPCIAIAFAKGVPTQSPAAAVNPDLDTFFDCDSIDSNEDPCYGVAYALAYGSKGFIDFVGTATGYALAYGTPVWGNAYEETATAAALAYGELLLEGSKRNLMIWSRSGSFTFDIDRDNMAGEGVMDWPGWIYQIKKLDKVPVIYGQNGVSFRPPFERTFGLKTIYRVGLKGKHAVTGTEDVHFFVDELGQFWRLSNELTLLGYEEFLSALTSNIVMSYNNMTENIYICDGVVGYVYSVRDESLGKGPSNITGIGNKDGTVYVVSSAAISIPAFERWSDIQDMSSRRLKTIQFIELGTEASNSIYVALSFRNNKASSFTQLPWRYVAPNGNTPYFCCAREFKIGMKMTTYEIVNFDYLRINGVFNDV